MSDSRKTEFTKRIVGSVMAEIDYADDRIIVFHYIDSLFVYDYINGKILHTFDLSKLNCGTHGQGDSGINISVHAGGNVGYLSNYGTDEEIEKLDNYLLDFTNGSVQKEPFAIVKPDTVFKDTFIEVKDAKGWFSDKCIRYDDAVFYLTTESSVMAGLKLCIYKDGTTHESMIFGNNDGLDVFIPVKSEDHDLAKYMLNEFMKIIIPENSIVTKFEYEELYYEDDFGMQNDHSFRLQAYIPEEDYDSIIRQLDSTMSKSSLSSYGIYDDLRHVAGWWRFNSENLTDIYEKTIHYEGYGPRIKYIKAFITKHNDGYLMFFSY